MKRFRISLDLDVTLALDEIWPDGDAPENPTAEDVEGVIEDAGPVGRWLSDWNLDDAIVLHVMEEPAKVKP